MITARELLDMEQVAENRFRCRHNLDNFQGAIFGGQPLGQALAAAQRTVAEWLPHTCTGYFLRGGVVAEPIDYQVEILRDGRRYASRRVLAIQSGRPVFDMLCSFHLAEAGFEHQRGEVEIFADPETLPNVLEFAEAHAERLPSAMLARVRRAFPVELRLVDSNQVFFGPPDHRRDYWFRMPSAAHFTDPGDHRALLAFMSDYWLASSAGAPHRSPAQMEGRFAVASLNHSLWFHAPMRADEWLLFRTESPWGGEGRGLARGLIYDRSGRLVASAAQEVSMRIG